MTVLAASDCAAGSNGLTPAVRQAAAEGEVPLSDKLKRFIAAVPKTELHIHIEGTLEPEMMLELAARNNLPAPYPSVEAARAAYDFKDLQSFLDLYYFGCSVLVTRKDFYDLTIAYFRRVSADGATHVEVMFDPQTHTQRGIAWETFLGGFNDAIAEAREKLGLEVQLLLSFLRHLSEEAAFQTLEQALQYKDQFCAIGLDSSELGNPPEKFTRVMAKARELGLRIVAHAGEEGPAQYIWDALNLLKVSRIDHGVHCLDDPELMRHLEESQMALTVCPLSNLKLKVFWPHLVQKLRELYVESNIVATVNSDDPAYFGGYLKTNYEWLAQVLGLNIAQVARIAKFGFQGAFMPEAAKQQAYATIDALAKKFEAEP